MSTKPSVLIVGAGEFGASTAVSLLKTGQYGKVTVLDRASVLPAMDAASTDMNKVVRWDYSDPDYSLLARKAIDIWNEEFKGIYFQSGVVVRGLESDTVDGEFGRKALANVKLLESSIEELNNPADFKSALDRNGRTPTSALPAESRGYANPVGGWAWAAKAVERLYEQLLELGGELVPSAEMSELIYENDDVVGAKTLDGREFRADKTIVALGSWTPSHPALKGLLKEGLIVATGQTIAAVQLDEEERELYKDIPVTFNFDGSGFYSFPPNPFGVLKFAIHGAGYLSETGVPRTAADPSAVLYTEENDLSWIPSESLKELRYQMSTIYPELAKKPVTYTRMCWYSDVVDGNWVIDYAKPSLLIASGGSGHAFKFLPIMGDLIRARLEGTLEPHLVDKFKLERNTTAEDPQRTGMMRQTLDLGALATGQELRVAA